MGHKILIILLGIVAIGSESFSEDLSGNAAAFADIGQGARAMAMGGAYTAVGKEACTVFWNPAGIADIGQKEVNLSYANHLGLIKYSSIAAAMPMGSQALGLGLISSGDDALRELSVLLCYGRSVGNLSVGGNLKLRYASFGDNKIDPGKYGIFEEDEISQAALDQVRGNAKGFGFDIGIIYRISDEISVGAAAKDIASFVYWKSENLNSENKPKGNYQETVPFRAILGSSARFFGSVTINADFEPAMYGDCTSKISTGVEGKIFDILSLRAGTNLGLQNDQYNMYSLGLGLCLAVYRDLRLRLDYSYLSVNKFADTQRISFAFEF